MDGRLESAEKISDGDKENHMENGLLVPQEARPGSGHAERRS
jgi:hypothetical protein